MKNGTDLAQSGTVKGRLARTHQDYWRSRLDKREYEWKGETVEIPSWQVRIAHRGRREWFNLETPNQTAAACKARDIYVSLVAAGWDATLAKFKPGMEVHSDGCTVGEFLTRVKAVSGLKAETFEIYAKKFRSLIADVFKVEGSAAKFYHKGEAYQKWLERVHAVKLARLTPERVDDWKHREQDAAAGNPLKLKQTKVTVRSVLLNSKALFNEKFRGDIGLRLPDPLPFEGVTLPKVGKSRYQSTVNPAELLAAARKELAGGDAEGFKILLLSLGAGLRRDEIDTLQWSQIQWHRNAINIETTEHGATKTDSSENDVSVDPGLLKILKKYRPKAGTGFVIESDVKPRNKPTYHHYRCNRHFKRLAKWLRSKGVTGFRPIHTMRKEFGSQVCSAGGIYAASRQLRHSSIVMTREIYTDSKPAVFEISKLMKGGKV